VGSYILPPVAVSYEYEGRKETLSTARIFVEVESVLPPEGEVTDIRDIKPLAPIPRDLQRLFLFGGACALALITAFMGVVFFIKRNQSRKTAAPLEPAHVIALNDLEQLDKKGLLEEGRIRLYYFELSEIFRRYLEHRFRFPAVEHTSEEIAGEITHVEKLSKEMRILATSVLKNTDQVKFAKCIPAPEDISRDRSDIKRFIEETREQEKE